MTPSMRLATWSDHVSELLFFPTFCFTPSFPSSMSSIPGAAENYGSTTSSATSFCHSFANGECDRGAFWEPPFSALLSKQFMMRFGTSLDLGDSCSATFMPSTWGVNRCWLYSHSQRHHASTGMLASRLAGGPRRENMSFRRGVTLAISFFLATRGVNPSHILYRFFKLAWGYRGTPQTTRISSSTACSR